MTGTAGVAGHGPGLREGEDRQESEAQREDRNVGELLQELRVAGLGIQVLFGFLLSLPFTVRFVKLSTGQRDLYLASLLLAALATALLCGPVAYHRLVFRRHQKGRLLHVANVMAIAGLAAVGLAVTVAVSLIVSFVEHGPIVVVVGLATIVSFMGLWFVFPMAHRGPRRAGSRPRPHRPTSGDSGEALGSTSAPLAARSGLSGRSVVDDCASGGSGTPSEVASLPAWAGIEEILVTERVRKECERDGR